MPTQQDVVKEFSNLQGGYNPRLTNALLADQQGPMQSPDCRNVSMFYPGGIEKRLGKTSIGGPTRTTWVASTDDNAAATINFAPAPSNTTALCALCQKIIAPSTKNIFRTTVKISFTGPLSTLANITNVQIRIQNDGGAGVPGGTYIASSNVIPFGTAFQKSLVAPGTFSVDFIFPTLPQLTSGTAYWFCLEMTAAPSYAISLLANTHTPTVNGAVFTSNAYITCSNLTTDIYYQIYDASTNLINGLYDFRYGASVQQVEIAACAGTVYYATPTWGASGVAPTLSSWTSLKTGLAAGANQPYDFAAYKDILILTDYANHIPQAWDGVASGTMELGYRMSPGYSGITGNQYTVSTIVGNVITFTTAPNATFVGMIQKLSGGATTQYLTVSAFSVASKTVTYSTAPNSDQTTMTAGGFTVADGATGTIVAGTYRLMAVTKLRSGGYRASAEQVYIAPGSKQLTVSNLKMNSSTDGTQYAWDIDLTATEWFMTLAGGTVYYKLAVASISTGLNPMANSVTTFNITAVPAGTENTLDIEYNLPQSYFTNQIDCPYAKYLTIFQDMVTSAGDPNNLNALWFSEQGTLHVWSTQGGYRGFQLNVARNDGFVMKGMHVRWGRLYALRTQSVNLVQFTGNSSVPFTNDVVQNQIGCLSHWSVEDVDEGFKFLSQQGPAICYGTYIMVDPKAQQIINLFQANDPNAFNLSLCLYSTSFRNPTKKQIAWTVASNGSSARDTILRHDYELGTYWLDDSLGANYLTSVVDSAGQVWPWSGDVSGQVFQHDTGLADGTIPVNFWWMTPPLRLELSDEQIVMVLRVLGDVQSIAPRTTGLVFIDEYVDGTFNATYAIDVTNQQFLTGVTIPLSQTHSHYTQFKFRCAENMAMKINGFKIILRPVRYQLS